MSGRSQLLAQSWHSLGTVLAHFNFGLFRIQALREELVSGKYDIVLLQEIIHIIESEKFGSDQF